MAKQQTEDLEVGEQIPLIDIEPENAKAIARAARAYKKAQKARMEALSEEIKQKEKLLAVVHQADIKANADGEYCFRAGDVTITVKPRDELVKVKFEKDADEED